MKNDPRLEKLIELLDWYFEVVNINPGIPFATTKICKHWNEDIALSDSVTLAKLIHAIYIGYENK